MKDYYLKLDENAVLFDPTGAVTNVFFDESNHQVYAVRSGGETGVVVSGPSPTQQSITFRITDKGSLISIKFAPDHRILAMQRSDHSVDFANFSNGQPDGMEYTQKCKVRKGKNNKVLNFHWLSSTTLVFITHFGAEFYQIHAEKRVLKLVKHFPCSTNWSVFSPTSSILVLSTTPAANILIPFQLKNGQIVKLGKFEVDCYNPTTTISPTTSSDNKPTTAKLLDRDVAVVHLYGQTYLTVLRHPNSTSNKDDKCRLDLYRLIKDGHVRKSFVLRLVKDGRFAFNVVDNLLVAHHQPSKISMIFDIKLPGVCHSNSNVICLEAVLPPCRIKPFTLRRRQGFDPPSNITSMMEERNCILYAKNWVVFQPNIIIDARIGCMWYLRTDLKDVFQLLPSDQQGLMVDFLLHRSSSKSVIISLCHTALQKETGVAQISVFFSKFNQVYKDYIDSNENVGYSQNCELRKETSLVFLDQHDVFSEILEPLVESPVLSFNYKISVLMEYIRSLNSFKIDVQQFINELIVKSLIKSRDLFYLQQLFRYKIITDSRQIANLLLDCEEQFPYGFHIALEILKRLAIADREIMEIMLKKRQVLQALRFIRSVGMIDLVPAHPFLQASLHDSSLFYSIYKFFEARNIRITGSGEFTAAQNCDEFRIHFIENFPSDSMENL